MKENSKVKFNFLGRTKYLWMTSELKAKMNKTKEMLKDQGYAVNDNILINQSVKCVTKHIMKMKPEERKKFLKEFLK